MKSLFNSPNRAEIIGRINSINQNSERQWGTMTAGQMFAHVQAPLKIATGELKLSTNLLFMILGPLLKKKLMKDVPFEKNLPTHKDFVIKFDPNLETEKGNLIAVLQTFVDQQEHLALKHPIFGKMNTQQWDFLNWKHLDHHLRQFGA